MEDQASPSPQYSLYDKRKLNFFINKGKVLRKGELQGHIAKTIFEISITLVVSKTCCPFSVLKPSGINSTHFLVESRTTINIISVPSDKFVLAVCQMGLYSWKPSATQSPAEQAFHCPHFACELLLFVERRAATLRSWKFSH